MVSREHVLNHEKYQQIFAKYATAIGIDAEHNLPEWVPIKEKMDKIEAEKRAQEEKKKQEEEAKRLAEEAKKQEEERLRLEKEEQERKNQLENAAKMYFKLLRQKNLTNLVGKNVRKMVKVKSC